MVVITLKKPNGEAYDLTLDDKHLKDAALFVRSNMMENPSVRGDDESGDDKALDVYQTVLIKSIVEDRDGDAYLVGTVIQRVLNPPEDFEYFPYRVNDRSASEFMEVRRIRSGKVFGSKAKNGIEEKGDSKDEAIATTFNVRLPFAYRKQDGFNYPFNVVEFFMDLEMSSVTVKGTQYRPSLHITKKTEHMCNVISIKTKRIEGVEGDGEECFNIEALDDMITYDFLRMRPDIEIPRDKKGDLSYYPKIKLSFFVEVPWKKNFITSTIPTGLLVSMQWINWYLNVYTHDIEENFGDYFGAALTIVLSTVVLIPMLQDKSTKSGRLSFADYLMVVLFVGTGISSAPSYGFIGSLLSTSSGVFILIACVQYYFKQRQIRFGNPKYQFSDFVLNGKKEKPKEEVKGAKKEKKSKPKGEDIDLNIWADEATEVNTKDLKHEPKKNREIIEPSKPTKSNIAMEVTPQVREIGQQPTQV